MDGKVPGILKRPLDPEKLRTHVKAWCVDGDIVSRDVIIEHSTRLAIHLARQYGKRFPNISDELIAEALATLVIAVDRFPRVHRDYEILPYIVTTIRRRLQTYVQHSVVIRVPERTLTRKSDLRQQTTVLTDKDWEKLPYIHKVTRLEWDEIVDLTARTTEDRLILELSREGYNLREIAAAFSKSISYVSRARTVVFARFRYYWLIGED